MLGNSKKNGYVLTIECRALLTAMRDVPSSVFFFKYRILPNMWRLDKLTKES